MNIYQAASKAPCPSECETHLIKDGPSGLTTRDGQCMYYVSSKYNWCGNSSYHMEYGTDCTMCSWGAAASPMPIGERIFGSPYGYRYITNVQSVVLNLVDQGDVRGNLDGFTLQWACVDGGAGSSSSRGGRASPFSHVSLLRVSECVYLCCPCGSLSNCTTTNSPKKPVTEPAKCMLHELHGDIQVCGAWSTLLVSNAVALSESRGSHLALIVSWCCHWW